jgi:hypothetical protein
MATGFWVEEEVSRRARTGIPGHVELLAKRLGALQLAEASARRRGDAEGVSTGKWRGWPPRLGE